MSVVNATILECRELFVKEKLVEAATRLQSVTLFRKDRNQIISSDEDTRRLLFDMLSTAVTSITQSGVAGEDSRVALEMLMQICQKFAQDPKGLVFLTSNSIVSSLYTLLSGYLDFQGPAKKVIRKVPPFVADFLFLIYWLLQDRECQSKLEKSGIYELITQLAVILPPSDLVCGKVMALVTGIITRSMKTRADIAEAAASGTSVLFSPSPDILRQLSPNIFRSPTRDPQTPLLDPKGSELVD